MMRLQLALGVIATMFVRTSAHGSMINPAPRQVNIARFIGKHPAHYCAQGKSRANVLAS